MLVKIASNSLQCPMPGCAVLLLVCDGVLLLWSQQLGALRVNNSVNQ